jgi:ABC transporter with metal-binding/Fe-S-binding domain ATP-binding protein
MKVAALFSGGKDSAFALWCAQQQGWEVKVLLTLCPKSPESYMFHHPNIEWTRLQAKAMGIPQLLRKTSGEKEKELEDLRAIIKEAVRKFKVSGIICGALASEYQKERVDFACEELGLKSFAPLWRKDQPALMREIADNFEVVITSVSAEGFDESWLGRKIDSACLSDLERLRRRYGVSVSGEGGEYESFVLNAPIFKKRIRIEKSEKTWGKGAGAYRIIRAVI